MKAAQTPSHQHPFQIILTQTLPPHFDANIWNIIQSTPPTKHLHIQHNILNILLAEQTLFETFFHRFYSNHLQIYKWYMLAHVNKNEIKQYLYKDLIKHPFKHYRQKIVDRYFRDKFSQSNQFPRTGPTTHQPINLPSFIEEQKLKNNPSEAHQLKAHHSEDEEKVAGQLFKQDYHELFLRTFKACDGSKYIHYDFDKHQKGIDDKKNYNKFIRVRKPKRYHETMVLQRRDEQIITNPLCSIHVQAECHQYFHQQKPQLQNLGYSTYTLTPPSKNQLQPSSMFSKVQSRVSLLKKKRPNFQVFKMSVLRKGRAL